MDACAPSWWTGWCKSTPSLGCCRRPCTCALPSWTDFYRQVWLQGLCTSAHYNCIMQHQWWHLEVKTKSHIVRNQGTSRARKGSSQMCQTPGDADHCWVFLSGQPAEKCWETGVGVARGRQRETLHCQLFIKENIPAGGLKVSPSLAYLWMLVFQVCLIDFVIQYSLLLRFLIWKCGVYLENVVVPSQLWHESL